MSPKIIQKVVLGGSDEDADWPKLSSRDSEQQAWEEQVRIHFRETGEILDSSVDLNGEKPRR